MVTGLVGTHRHKNNVTQEFCASESACNFAETAVVGAFSSGRHGVTHCLHEKLQLSTVRQLANSFTFGCRYSGVYISRGKAWHEERLSVIMGYRIEWVCTFCSLVGCGNV